MKPCGVCALSLVLWHAFSYEAQAAESTGDKSPAIGTVQGNANIVYDSSQKTSVQIINVADTTKLNVLQRHQHALLIAEHPTTVKVAGIDFLNWSTDTEKFLTVKLRNVNKLPAYRVEYGITDQRFTGRTNKVRFLSVPQSSSVPKNIKLNYGIEPGEEFLAPLISISDLRKYLNVPIGYCIVMPRVLEGSNTYPSLPYKQTGISTSVDMLLPFTFMYQTIFEQRYIINSPLAIILARRDSLIPPGPSDNASYPRCID